jgi:catechol 2,3-dioxygenase-like lactoylglutathione lyase family enzyme
MLGDSEAIATIAVKDLTTARKFYEGTLGLELTRATGTEALTFKTGRSELIVYRSPNAGTNKATAVSWRVGRELDAIVAALKARGVSFEHYDLPGLTQKGDVHAFGELKTAWFKDPDGNIIALMNL